MALDKKAKAEAAQLCRRHDMNGIVVGGPDANGYYTIKAIKYLEFSIYCNDEEITPSKPHCERIPALTSDEVHKFKHMNHFFSDGTEHSNHNCC